MTATVLIIGVGDLARHIALGLASTGRVGTIILASRNEVNGDKVAALVSSSHPVKCRFRKVDALDQSAVVRLITDSEPDLILQNASLMGPFDLVGRTDPAAKSLAGLGRGPLLPVQLSVAMSVMAAVRAVGYDGPTANLSLPDITNPILHALGLAPTLGLGNAEIVRRRVLSLMVARDEAATGILPLIRVIAHHGQVVPALNSSLPQDADHTVRVYLGDEGERADHLAYGSPALPLGKDHNIVTSAASVPVLLAMLPGNPPLRVSTPGPKGLPGGYPVTVSGTCVELDLPPGVDLNETVRFQDRMAHYDGVAHIAEDGTTTFTSEVREALAEIEPRLSEPLHPSQCLERWHLIRGVLDLD